MSIRRWNQKIIRENEWSELHLWHPDGRSGIHLFDIDQEDIVTPLSWRHLKNGYAKTWNPFMHEYMTLHQLVMLPIRAKEIDHINRNKYDSRRVNLRPVTPRENKHNRSDKSIYGVGVYKNPL